ncbi:MAG: DUF6265 family protein [Planctomycetota bacterium]
MRQLIRTSLIVAAALGAACAGRAWDAPLEPVDGGATAHTYLATEPPRVEPDAALERLSALLAGRWRGQGFGGEIEETWNPLLGGRMLGTFRLVEDGALVFSEHMQISEEDDGRVALSLVHLDPSLKTWEARGDKTRFVLIDASDTTAWFGGLTLHRTGDALRVHLAMKNEDGTREEVLEMRDAGFVE